MYAATHKESINENRQHYRKFQAGCFDFNSSLYRKILTKKSTKK